MPPPGAPPPHVTARVTPHVTVRVTPHVTARVTPHVTVRVTARVTAPDLSGWRRTNLGRLQSTGLTEPLPNGYLFNR